MGKYKGKAQRLCLGEVDQQIQGHLDSHRQSVCCLVLNLLFFGYIMMNGMKGDQPSSVNIDLTST